jgi:nucleoside-diphosphate-sugar epimerase
MYATTKYIGEQMLKTNNKYIIMRFANVFGGVNFIEDKTSVVAKFIRMYQRNAPIQVNGTGNQTRDFVHVDDICTAIIRCINGEITNKCMDVGTGIETMIVNMACMFDHPIVFNEDSDMVGVESNVADPDALMTLTGFRPIIPLSGYIRDIVS